MVYHKGLKVLSMSGLLAPLFVIVTKKGLYWVSQHYAVKMLPLKMNLCSVTTSHIQHSKCNSCNVSEGTHQNI